jgi:hypothetical protein
MTASGLPEKITVTAIGQQAEVYSAGGNKSLVNIITSLSG